MQFLKRQLPVILAFVAGSLLWAQFYVPSRMSQQALEVFTSSWLIIMAGAALILGILSALHYHWSKIKLKKPGFAYSIITLVAFTITAVSGWFPIKVPGFAGVAKADDSLHGWITNYILVPLDATMFAILAFFIASAAFRAFRARSLDATALLVAGCIVMLGRVPVGEMIPVFPAVGSMPVLHINDVSGWIMNNLNTAGQTGILLGVMLSIIAISLRVIFGIERTYMGGGD